MRSNRHPKQPKQTIMIQYGSIEYFQLLSFHDKLKSYHLDKLDLLNLDRLRTEMALKIEAINETENKRRKSQNKQ